MNHLIDPNDLARLEHKFGKITEWVPGVVDPKTGKINPQQTMVLLGENTFASVFHVKPIYYETYLGTWRPLSEVTEWLGNHNLVFNSDWWKVHPRYMAWLEKRMKLINGTMLIPSPFKTYPTPYTGIVRELHQSLIPPKIGLTTTTVYPDPSVESTSVDGWAGGVNQTSWANARDATTSSSAQDSVTQGQISGEDESAGANDYACIRFFCLYDTSGIADGDTISSATMTITIVDAGGRTGGAVMGALIQTSPASNTAITTADFDALTLNSPTLGATAIDLNASTGAKEFTLNANGLGWISKTGITKLGVRDNTFDVPNTTPTPAGRHYCQNYHADVTGTSNDPVLVVVHSGSTPTTTARKHTLALMGVG